MVNGEIWEEIKAKEEQRGEGSGGLETAHASSLELIVHISLILHPVTSLW